MEKPDASSSCWIRKALFSTVSVTGLYLKINGAERNEIANIIARNYSWV